MRWFTAIFRSHHFGNKQYEITSPFKDYERRLHKDILTLS